MKNHHLAWPCKLTAIWMGHSPTLCKCTGIIMRNLESVNYGGFCWHVPRNNPLMVKNIIYNPYLQGHTSRLCHARPLMQAEARPYFADCPWQELTCLQKKRHLASTHFYQQPIQIIWSCLMMELQNPIVSHCSVIKTNILKGSFCLVRSQKPWFRYWIHSYQDRVG